MKRALLLVVCAAACERAGGETYAIGWAGPTAGDQVEVISKLELHEAGFGDHVRSLHALFVDTTTDGELITGEKVAWLEVSEDGIAQHRVGYELAGRGSAIHVAHVDGNMTEEERVEAMRDSRLTFADPGPRKRFVLHRFHIGEAYKPPADEVDALALPSDVTVVLRAAHGDKLAFEIEGTVDRAGVRWKLRGTLDTDGPNYRYFHLLTRLEAGSDWMTVDHLQKRPAP